MCVPVRRYQPAESAALYEVIKHMLSLQTKKLCKRPHVTFIMKRDANVGFGILSRALPPLQWKPH